MKRLDQHVEDMSEKDTAMGRLLRDVRRAAGKANDNAKEIETYTKKLKQERGR